MSCEKCEVCGKEFETTKPNLRYCSVECRRRAEKIRALGGLPEKKKCQFCGQEIYGFKKYCSDRCRALDYAARSKAYSFSEKKKPKAEKPNTEQTITYCSYCGCKIKVSRCSEQRKFCCDAHMRAYRRTGALALKTKGKTLSDWAKEADECNLDYGTYRALIASGKTYDELKATAPNRELRGHSHIHMHTR